MSFGIRRPQGGDRVKLKGIMGAPTTAFKPDGVVDYDTFGSQVDFLIKQGFPFIAHPMHIGESINLSESERKELARILVDTAVGRVPVFVNVTASGPDNSIDLARHAEAVGATGIVVLSPYHWRPGDKAHLDYFLTMGGCVDSVLIAYNNPSLQVTISHDMLEEMLEKLPNFHALKDASFDMNYFTGACRIASAARSDFSVFTGIEWLLTSIPVGGSGSFSNCGEVAPRLVLSLYDACVSGDYEKARALQYKMDILLHLLQTNYPATVKYAMELMGRPVGETRKPILPLDDDAKAHTRTTLESLGIFESEPSGW